MIALGLGICTAAAVVGLAMYLVTRDDDDWPGPWGHTTWDD